MEAAAQDNVFLPLSLFQSVHALNNLKLYSTASDKVNQTTVALTETQEDNGGNITAGYLTLCDKQNMQHKDDHFPDY